MHRKRIIGLTAALACVATAAGCGGGSGGATSTTQQAGTGGLVGAGSTLVQPLVAQWQQRFNVNYGAIGSGGGIAQITNKTVDFGASDAPLQGDQKRAGLLQIPWALAATVVAVNVPGVAQHPRLTGPVLADIYLGKVKSWNDPAIAKLNPGLKLPSTKIVPLYRSDGSGDTFAFTSYLTKVSPQWSAKVGASTAVSWPTGTGAKGNSGMAGLLSQTPGAIAYIAIAQVRASHLDYALLRNSAGRYPDPSSATIAQAASKATFAPDHSASIVDEPVGYPISTFTYVLVWQHSPKAAALQRFLRYAVGPGQSFATKLAFAPLPASVRGEDLKVIASLAR